MNKIILIGVATLLLLFAGCINLPSTSPAIPEKGNEITEQTGGEQPTGATEETITEKIDNLKDAVMQRVPLECIATVEGESITTHYWIKDGNVRIESEYEDKKMVVIVKNNISYIQASTFEEMPQGVTCDWIKFEQGKSKPETGRYSASLEDYENMASVKVECNPAVFGDEKFETSGKICTMADLIPPMENLPPGYEACEGLSGQALIDCLQQYQE